MVSLPQPSAASNATPDVSAYTLRWLDGISAVDRQAWDRLALPLETPFLEWTWLHELERSGSIVPETGWYPRHLTIWNGPQLAAAAPLYIKTHSEGEFVFDYVWADVAAKLNISYYPKLLGMSPVTPVDGYRFLIAKGRDEKHLTGLLLAAMERFCQNNGLSGYSFLHVAPDWGDLLHSFGIERWQHQGFSWQNPGHRSFEDYLRGFKANQRRNIKRECRRMAQQGIVIKTLTGDQITEEFMSRMYTFYVRTNKKFGPYGCKYLNEAFFKGLYRHYRHRLLLVAAFEDNRQQEMLGASLLIYKGDSLYGRYWGSERTIDALHFNACFYRPIQWAIHHGIRWLNPGIGGGHKLRRGMTAVPTYSYHRFFDLRLDTLFRNHIGRFNQAEQQQIIALNQAIPLNGGHLHKTKGESPRDRK